MRTPRNLSGIYFRYQNPETGNYENWCFEDLPVEKQIELCEGRSKEWIQSLVLSLCQTFREISDDLNIKSGE
jgi:hypothetical protein